MALTEICVASYQSAAAAFEGGAQRIELCDNLYEGGTTPSAGMIEQIRNDMSLQINVLIRPRGGDFMYSEQDMSTIKNDIYRAKSMGVDGVVFGFLTAYGKIDRDKTMQAMEWAHPLDITFHRAFDMTENPYASLEVLLDLGIPRLLTSGQKNSATQAIILLQELIQLSGDQLIIMPGGGLTDDSIEEFAKRVKAKEYHATLRSVVPSPMQYRKKNVFMGGLPEIPEFDRKETDPQKVAKFVRILINIHS